MNTFNLPIEPVESVDLDDGDLKVAVLAERVVVKGEAAVGLSVGQCGIDIDAVAFAVKINQRLYIVSRFSKC